MMESEIECFYDGFEREYGMYFTDELDLSHCYRMMEVYSSAGHTDEEVLDAVKSMIISAGDEALMRQLDE
jgi:hypothetical protein